MSNEIKFAFFGTSEFSVGVLEVLKARGYTPRLIVTTEDKPQGRGLKLSPPPAKVWAEIHQVPILQPTKLDPEFTKKLKSKEANQLFIVASYGKLIPKSVFELPEHKTLNVHPSLLPMRRGASPIEYTILEGEQPGVTIMQISEGMDEGPIVAQQVVDVPEWQDNPPRADILEELLAREGGELLADILPDWLEGQIAVQEQDALQATLAPKIKKEDTELNLNDDPLTNLRKVRAYATWPGAYMFYKKANGEEVRLVVKEAELDDEGKFKPLRVTPASKKEMDYTDFLRGNQ